MKQFIQIETEFGFKTININHIVYVDVNTKGGTRIHLSISEGTGQKSFISKLDYKELIKLLPMTD